jgi:hypothetical protein
MSSQLNRFAARGFTEANLPALAADIIAWRRHSALASDAMLHQLANLCVPFASEGDEYQEAERMVVTFSLQQASQMDAIREQFEKQRILFDKLRTQLISHNALADFGPELFEIINVDRRTGTGHKECDAHPDGFIPAIPVKELGTKPDDYFAAQFKTSIAAIQVLRKKNGIPPFRPGQ